MELVSFNEISCQSEVLPDIARALVVHHNKPVM